MDTLKPALAAGATIVNAKPGAAGFAEHQFFQALFRSSVAGIAKLDAQVRFEIVNDRFCEITGRTREELIGTSCYDITHPDDRAETEAWLVSLMEGAELFSIEKRYVRPDGSCVWVSKGVSAIRSESGALEGAVAIVTDVTSRRAAEEALRASEQRYRDLLESVGLAVYTTDADGRITFYNEAAADLWGRRPEVGVDLWCGSWRILNLDGTLLPHDECPMAVCLKENLPVRGQAAIAERPDGSRVVFMPFPSPLRDASGALVGAVNVLIDVTEGKRNEAEADRQRRLVKAITDNMSVGLLMIDTDGCIEYMNPAAERITGYRFADVQGKRKHDVLHHKHADGTPYPESDCPIQVQMASLGLVEHEDVYVRPDGSFYNILCNVAPIVQDGVYMGAVMDLRDATEEKKAEDAVRQSMAVKDQFLSLVSHELRTPIATVLGNALLLLRRGDSLPVESREQSLEDIAHETEKLQRIIENLLLLTRMEAGQHLEPEPISLRLLIGQAVASFQRRTPGREIRTVEEAQSAIVLGQPAMLPLVLENLLANADKYSDKSKPVEVIVSDDGPERVRVCVRDYGIGVHEDDREEIFTPFYRSPNARSHAKGIGLGLAVCKRIIEAQDGRIWVERRPEGGSDFVFCLQRAHEGV